MSEPVAPAKARKLVLKTCACGTRFITEHLRHDTCRRCMRDRRKAATRMAAPAQQRDELRKCLHAAFNAGTLPASAKVTQRGTQVIVVWQGRSHTFYVAKAA